MNNKVESLYKLADEALKHFLEKGNFAEKTPNELAEHFGTDIEMINQAITLINGRFDSAIYIKKQTSL